MVDKEQSEQAADEVHNPCVSQPKPVTPLKFDFTSMDLGITHGDQTKAEWDTEAVIHGILPGGTPRRPW